MLNLSKEKLERGDIASRWGVCGVCIRDVSRVYSSPMTQECARRPGGLAAVPSNSSERLSRRFFPLNQRCLPSSWRPPAGVSVSTPCAVGTAGVIGGKELAGDRQPILTGGQLRCPRKYRRRRRSSCIIPYTSPAEDITEVVANVAANCGTFT